jgi:hypothetical protein
VKRDGTTLMGFPSISLTQYDLYCIKFITRIQTVYHVINVTIAIRYFNMGIFCFIFLFVCSLFKDAVSSPDYIASIERMSE